MKPKVLIAGHFPPSAGGITSFLHTVFQSPITQDYELLPFNIGRPAKPNVINNTGYQALFNSGLGRMLLAIRLTLWHMVLFPLVLLRKRPAMVHIHTAQFLVFWETAYYVLVTWLFRLPCILQFHASFRSFYEASGSWLRAAIQWIIRRVTVFVVICTEDKDYLIQQSKGRLPCVYLPNFIDIRAFRHEVERARAGIEKSQEVAVLFLGGSESIHKGFFELLEAMRRLIPQSRLRFFLVAVPQEEVKRRLPTGLLAHCDFQGWVSGAAKACVFAKADIFVLPSHSEGMPIGILEAMAASIPVIATRVGGIPDLITEAKEGYLIDPGDAEGLAQTISQLASDAKTKEEMGKKGFETALDKYDVSVGVKGLETLYTAILEPKLSLVKAD